MTSHTANTHQPRAKRRYLVIPIIIVAIIFAIYSGVWMFGAKIMERELDTYIASEKSQGRNITYSKRRIEGYPFSLRTQIDDFTWEDPGNWAWSGKRLYVITLPYDVTRIILAPRFEQKLSIDGTIYNIDSKAINIGLKQGAYSAEARKFNITDGIQQIALGTLRVNWDDTDNGGWRLSAAIRQGAFTDRSGETFEIPFWNLAAENQQGGNEKITLKAAELAVTDATKIAPTLFTADGKIGLDRINRPIGNLNISIRDEKALLNILRRYDIISETDIDQVSTALATYRATNPEADIAVSARDGQLYILGVIPVAPLGPLF